MWCRFVWCAVNNRLFVLYRYYFYAQEQSGSSLFLVEMVVATEARQATVTIKSDAAALVPEFVELWTTCLAGFYR